MTTSTIFPTCPYCGLLLSENERDSESGYFYSAHWTCTSENPNGQFEVVTRQHAVSPVQVNIRRFSSHKRAVEMAQELRRWNRREWVCGAKLDIVVRKVSV